MITEFSCMIFSAHKSKNIHSGPEWLLTSHKTIIAVIDIEGKYLKPTPLFPTLITGEELIEIAVLMNNIKRQYKQLNHAANT